jgi:cysteinyl-tRNA synthetase
MHSSFYQTQTSFHNSLCDSFNTPDALIHLRDLVSRTNVYINSQGKNLNIGLIDNITRWVGKMLKMFGLGEGETTEIGWGQEATGDDNINVSLIGFSFVHLGMILTLCIKREEVLMPYLRTLSSFRDGVRRLAMAKGDDALKDILALCDNLRDADLVPLGVALDDQPGKSLLALP